MATICELEHICQRPSREYCQRAILAPCSRPEYDPKVKSNFEKTVERCGRLHLWKYIDKKEKLKNEEIN